MATDLRRGRVLRVASLLALSCMPLAARADDGAFPVSARARLNMQLTTGAGTTPWPWDAQSHSTLDGSRFMVDLTAGRDRTGVLYLKGAANWQDAVDADGRVRAVLEQGDYLFRRGTRERSIALRVFGDERRFFTGELAAPSMDDDTVERFEHRFGGIARAVHDAWSADVTVASLDEGGDARGLERVAAAFSSRYLHAGLSFQQQDQYDGDNRIARGELGGWYGPLSVVASYAQSDLDGGGGTFSGDGSHARAWIGELPDDAAAFAELRLRRFTVARLRIDTIYRYDATGFDYVNDLVASRPGSVINTVGLYGSHTRHALDGRVTYRDEDRFAWEDARVRTLEASARAFLRDNSQLSARGGVERRTAGGDEERDGGFVSAGYRRELQRFMGGAIAMVDRIGEDAGLRAGVEARVNWNATSALYARWIVADDSGRAAAPFARLEFRPTARAWVTLAYGHADTGDGPYPLEDAIPFPGDRDLFTITVRGDF